MPPKAAYGIQIEVRDALEYIFVITLFGFCFLLFSLPFFIFEFTRPMGLLFLCISVAIIFVGLVVSGVKQEKLIKEVRDRDERNKKNLAAAEFKVTAIVAKHLEILANRRDTLVRVDRYGVMQGADWNKEVQHFIDNVVRPALTSAEAEGVASAGINTVFQRLIEDRVAGYCADRQVSTAVPAGISPAEFEGLCAASLRKVGWEATTTKGSGDQGADVVASKDGFTVVVQCKFHSAAIGNKSVQEALAAKSYYSADRAIVVSAASDFTKSARQLAQASGVQLVTYSELSGAAAGWTL